MSDYTVTSGRLEFHYHKGAGWAVLLAPKGQGCMHDVLTPVQPETGLVTLRSLMGIDRDVAWQVADVLRRFAEQGTIRPPTRVVCVRGWDQRERIDGEEVYDPVEYVGRKVSERSALGPGRTLWAQHLLHNPFKVKAGAGPDKRAAAVAEYTEYLKGWVSRDPEWARAVEALRGKRLGCWCGTWDGSGEPGFHCHAVVLARMADGLPV